MKFNDISDRFPWVWAAAGALLFWAVLMVTIGSFSLSPHTLSLVPLQSIS